MRVLFTKETARLMSVKAIAARRANKAKRKSVDRKLEELEDKITALRFDKPSQPEHGYAESRLLHVRAQLHQVDELIKKTSDSETLDLLTRSQLRLSQQEFALAGRPMPGQLRPTQAAARRVTIDLQSSPFGPAPVAPALPPVPQATQAPPAPQPIRLHPGSFKRSV